MARGDTNPQVPDGDASELQTAVSTPSEIRIDERVALQRTAQRLLGRRNWVRVGRYEVIENIGRGACGLVLGATDPKLDRKVAIKLVLPSRGRRGDGEQWQARLLREAQALAQLRHPNVVEVFDVGEHDGGVYLVMQWLRGRTLRQWIADEQPPWSDIVEAYAAAGRALETAHARGLIHRDFKPDNVMIESSGPSKDPGPIASSVKVIDFGLTRATPSHSDSSSGLASGTADEGLTRADTVLGTPAYMAPEQHAGSESEAAADQFAFCVSLYEGLWGTRPFGGKTLEALHEAKARQAITPPPRESKTPRWLWPIVRRGLARDPEQRWPSMRALVDALQRRRSPRRAWLVAAGLTTVAAGAFAWTFTPDEAGAVCEELDRRRHVVWNASRAAALGEAVAAVEVPFAADTASRLQSRLDAYVERWTEVRDRVCGSGQQLRVAPAVATRCLQQRLEELDGLIRVFDDPTPQLAVQAVVLTNGLADVRGCDGTNASSTSERQPGVRFDDAAEVWASLSRVQMLRRAGDGPAALQQARKALDAARHLGEPTAIVRASIATAEAEGEAGNDEVAEQLLTTAVGEAERLSMDDTAAEAALAMVDALADAGRFEGAWLWLRRAETIARRQGSPAHLQRELLRAEAYLLRTAGDPVAAYELLTRAAELSIRDEDSLRRASLLGNAAAAAWEGGREAEARALVADALESYRRELGPEHPWVGHALAEAGKYDVTAGYLSDAEKKIRQGLALMESTGTPTDRSILAKEDLASTVLGLERTDEAIALQREAYEEMRALRGPDHFRTAFSALKLARLLVFAKRADEAAPLVSPASATLERTYGASSRWLLGSEDLWANILAQQGDIDGARRRYFGLLERCDPSDAFERSVMVHAAVGLAELERNEGNLEAAARTVQRVLNLIEHDPDVSSLQVAGLLYVLATVQRDRGRIADAAQAARGALRRYARGGTTSAQPAELVAIVVQEAHRSSSDR